MKWLSNSFGFKQSRVNVSDAMNPSPVTVRSDFTVLRAAEHLVSKGIGGLLVVDDGVLKGILTKTDILEKLIVPKKNAAKLLVEDIMTKRFVSVGPNMNLSAAVKVMVEHDIRRLPVVHKGKLMGLLTQSDILVIQPQLIDSLVDKFLQNTNTIDIRSLKDVKGSCDICGNFESLRRVASGDYLCAECEKSYSKKI